MKTVQIKVNNVTRDLPIVKVDAVQYVALVEFLGDSELTNAVAQEMLSLIDPKTEVMFTMVTNALPLVHEISDRSGIPYVVARKRRRTYMKNPIIQEVQNLSLGVGETLWLDEDHANRLKGKKVTIVQDVVSSGSSAMALARMVERVGGEVIGYIAAFHQGKKLDFELKTLNKLGSIAVE